MITAGAISISKMMILNHSLQELNMSDNEFGDDGISAIAEAFGSCNISDLDVNGCNITLTGIKSLAAAFSFNHTIRNLWLMNNPITVEGALLIVNSAVYNTVCHSVEIDNEYENLEVEMMMDILEEREREVIRHLS